MDISFRRPKNIRYTVSTAEAGSGIVYIPFSNTATADNPSDDMMFNVQVRTSAGVEKAGFKSNFSTISGLVVQNDGSATFAANDVVTALGIFV